jgi:hypothetical protein
MQSIAIARLVSGYTEYILPSAQPVLVFENVAFGRYKDVYIPQSR